MTATVPPRRLRWLAVAAGLVLLPAAAVGREPARGAVVFQRVCSSCHGEKGDGRSLASQALRTPPRDFTAEAARVALSREYMIAIVRDGRPHTAMVGRAGRLAHEDIEAAVDFIRAAFMPPEPGSPLARGRSLYRSACAACHGDRGQGGGRAGSPPLSASRARPGLDGKAMTEAVLREEHVRGATTRGLPPPPGEAADVVAYIREAFIEAGTRPRGGSR